VGEPGPTITLLGRVAIARGDDAPAAGASRGRRVELVFAYLAVEHRRLVTHDELAEALWPEGLPSTWEAGLRGVLTEVRRFLAERGLDPAIVLATARRGYQLQLPPSVTVDVDEARAALTDARALLGRGEPSAAAERAARAATLAALPFLPNHDGEWVDGIRRELATINGRALEIEAQARAAAGDLSAAATAAERLVRAEPFNEAAHQLRIGLLGRAGDRSGAIRAYEHCREVLAAELGVEPSDETVAVYRAAVEPGAATTRSGADASGAPSPAPVPVAASPDPTATDGLAGISVLVVEDHDFQRRTATMLLRNLGVGTVTDAADGVAALGLLTTSSVPDVVLCDLDMPGMDGVEFIRHVAEGELACAVIIASALDAKVIQAVRAVGEGYGLQVLGTIEKPLTARRLGELLASYRRPPHSRAATPSPAAGGAPVTGFDVANALAAGRITFHLQPSVDVATGLVAAIDVVPRWFEPSRGWVPPDVFLPVIDRERLGPDLAARGLELACAQVRDHTGAGLDLGFTVDLAPDGLHDTGLADEVARVVRAAGADPARLTFTLRERALRNASGAALGVLTRLRVKGFGLSLAGFGTGHAPVERLRAVPLTEVKLDAVLVAGAASDPQRARALEETVDIGRELGATVVGDGCASDDDLRLLLSVGCDRVQGAFIAAAMPGDELPGWVAGWDPDRLVTGPRR
jgi:EAL domain-containing protein (putative c-di-GMP-specific phosphodiesterase class I)/DNA-binding SARP family transcriptional activator